MSIEQQLATLYLAHLDLVRDRFDRALAAGGFDRVVIHSGSPHIAFLDDYHYPFKVNPQFKSWIPVLMNPHCAIVYEPAKKPVLAYYQPVDYWHKPAENPVGYWTSAFDIKMMAEPGDLVALIGDASRTAFVGESDSAPEGVSFAAVNPRSVIDILHYERAWKSDYEISCILEANRIAARGHLAASKAFHSGASEYEIHLEYLRASEQIEEELPYGNIVALNENGAVLHYQQHLVQRSRNGERRSFLIDAGAQYNGYASDITRTYSSKQDDFAQLIDSMDAMQKSLCEEVRPGLDYKELHLSAHRKIGDILQKHGITDVDGPSALDLRITSAFFPHGVGHYLGLQVHDVGGFLADASGATIPKPEGHPYLRLTRTVEPKQVFTIEPGLYFIDSLLAELKKSDAAKHVKWSRVEELRPYGGIRIEDNVVVDADGHENLTRRAFADVS